MRQYGRDSIQVMRRLRAMIQNLVASLPAIRTDKLIAELELLNNSLRRTFPDLHDQTLAETGDFQGLGGSREAHVSRVERYLQTVTGSPN